MGYDERGAEPGESPKARHDRELIELPNELRVAPIVCVVLLVADYIFELTTAIAAAAVIGCLFVLFWCVLPLRGRQRR